MGRANVAALRDSGRSTRRTPHLFRKDLITGAETQILPPPSFSVAEDVSPDGKTLVFTQRTANGNFDVWTLPVDTLRGPSTLIESPFDETSVRFSRDGRYIAFASDELGHYEVYVEPAFSEVMTATLDWFGRYLPARP